MSRLIAVAADKGAPGVTTSALALALGWDDEVLVAEVDPAGANLPWVGRTTSGVLDPQRGVVSLAGEARVATSTPSLDAHVQTLDGGLPVLVGPAGPEQATAIGSQGWSLVTAALRADRRDVLADCGRVLSPSTPIAPVLQAADLVVLIARPRVESVAHLRHGLRVAAETLNATTEGGAGLARLAVVVVDEGLGGRRAARRSVAEVIAATPGMSDVPVAGVLAWDPRAAAALAGRGGLPPRSRLLASARDCAAELRARVDDLVITGTAGVRP